MFFSIFLRSFSFLVPSAGRTKLYTSYKAHINLIQGSYELNYINLTKGNFLSRPISLPLS